MSGQTDRLSRKEAALYLRTLGVPITARTLERYAGKGKRCGPPFIRFGWRMVTYERGELEAWAKSQTVRFEGEKRT